MDKIGIIGDALAPSFNEALANQMYLLSHKLEAPVLTCNNLGLVPLKKMGRYLIVNARFLREGRRAPFLSALNGAFFYPFIKVFERKLETIYLTGGITSGFLRYVDLSRCVLLMNSLPFNADDEEMVAFARQCTPRLKGIIAYGGRIRDKLVASGVDDSKVHFMYPWVDLDKFKNTKPPELDRLKLLFASAPNLTSPDEDIFAAKGLPLLLETIKELIGYRKVLLRVLWRGYETDRLIAKLKELALESHTEVINRVVNTAEILADTHITVVPFTELKRSPEIPLSAVESLACGRPVVTTSVTEIAGIVEENKCGCVAPPQRDKLSGALRNCFNNYSFYQKNCRGVAEKFFALSDEKLRLLRECAGEKES